MYSRIKDHLATQNSSLDQGLVEFRNRDLEDVAIDHEKVGELSFLDRAELLLPAEADALGTAYGEALDRLLQGDRLVSVERARRRVLRILPGDP